MRIAPAIHRSLNRIRAGLVDLALPSPELDEVQDEFDNAARLVDQLLEENDRLRREIRLHLGGSSPTF